MRHGTWAHARLRVGAEAMLRADRVAEITVNGPRTPKLLARIRRCDRRALGFAPGSWTPSTQDNLAGVSSRRSVSVGGIGTANLAANDNSAGGHYPTQRFGSELILAARTPARPLGRIRARRRPTLIRPLIVFVITDGEDGQ